MELRSGPSTQVVDEQGHSTGVSASSRAAARRRAPRGTDRRLPQGPAAAGAARPELVRPRPDRSVCDSRGGKCGGRRDRVPLGRPETLPGRATHGEACRLGGRWQSKESGKQLLQGGAGVAKRRGPDRFPRPRGEIRPASSPLSAFSFLPHRNPLKGVRRARDKAELSPAPPFPSKYAHGAARGPGPTGAAPPRAAGTGAANPAARATPGLAAGVYSPGVRIPPGSFQTHADILEKHAYHAKV